MTAHQTWWDYNAHRFARYGVRKRNNRMILVALMAAVVLIVLATSAHAQDRTRMPCEAYPIDRPCGITSGLPLGGTSLRYSRARRDGFSLVVPSEPQFGDLLLSGGASVRNIASDGQEAQ